MIRTKAGLKARYRSLRKNFQALGKANLTLAQVPGMAREFRLWWRITRNFRALEGSWVKAVATYARMFEGVPRKSPSPPQDR